MNKTYNCSISSHILICKISVHKFGPCFRNTFFFTVMFYFSCLSYRSSSCILGISPLSDAHFAKNFFPVFGLHFDFSLTMSLRIQKLFIWMKSILSKFHLYFMLFVYYLRNLSVTKDHKDYKDFSYAFFLKFYRFNSYI